MVADKYHVLIVEDEESLAKTLALNFELEGYIVTTINSGSEAVKYFNNHSSVLHLVLLDVMLPGINGFELCTTFRQINQAVPVIFLTAKSSSSETIAGLKLGADDYISKPFDLEELMLRVNNVIKRNNPKNIRAFTFVGGSINFETFEITNRLGNTIVLSRREIGLLKLLIDKENKVVSRDEIIEKLWDINENASSRTIDNYILSFRKQFEANPKEPRHFHSVRGVGYRFTA